MPQQGKSAPPVVAKNFLIYDRAFTFTEQAQLQHLGPFGVDAVPVDWVDAQSIESAGKAVNKGFKKVTSERMKGFDYEPPQLPEESMVFLNLCFFKDKWITSFDPGKTKRGVFYLRDGTQSSVDFISGKGRKGRWLENEFFKLVELPYQSTDHRLSMVLVLPHLNISSQTSDRRAGEIELSGIRRAAAPMAKIRHQIQHPSSQV